MSKTAKVPIEEIEAKAARGEDVSMYFTGEFKKMPPMKGPIVRVSEEKPKEVQRVNVDFASSMLEEIDQFADSTNVPRQSMIKMMIRAGLDQHYAALKGRQK